MLLKLSSYKTGTFKYYLCDLKTLKNIYQPLGVWAPWAETEFTQGRSPTSQLWSSRSLEWGPGPPGDVPHCCGRARGSLPNPDLLSFHARVGIANGHNDPLACPERSTECSKLRETFPAPLIALHRDATTPQRSLSENCTWKASPRQPRSVSKNDSG